MRDVACIGELLIDFTSLQAGASIVDTPGFEKHAGGGTANVAVGVSRLGGRAAFLGMVGDDEFGRFLARELETRGVELTGLRYTREAHTTLAFVALREDGEREFIFYRNPGADMLLTPDDVDTHLVEDSRILHHGSISLIAEPSRSATLHAVEVAKGHGRLVSYDPNLRLNLWPSADAAYAGIALGLPHADIVKVSEDELAFITGDTTLEGGMAALAARGVPAIVVTLGAQGCVYRWGELTGAVPARPRQAVDTTGAGDAFVAGLLYRLARRTPVSLDLPHEELEDILAFANAVAGRVVLQRGAIPAMPTLDEIAADPDGDSR
jgi:fructokinase